jgi:hypothetical protein
MAIFNSYVSLPEGTSGWSTVDIFRYDIHGCLNFCKVWPTKSKLGTWKTPSIPEGVGLAALSLAALAAQLWSYEVMPNWQGWRKLILLNLTCPATHKVAKQKTQLQLIHFLFIKWQGHIEHWPLDFCPRITPAKVFRWIWVFFWCWLRTSTTASRRGISLALISETCQKSAHAWTGNGMRKRYEADLSKSGAIQSFKVQPVQESKITHLQ